MARTKRAHTPKPREGTSKSLLTWFKPPGKRDSPCADLLNKTADRAIEPAKTNMKTNDQSEPNPGVARESKLAFIGTIEIASGRRDQLLPLPTAQSPLFER